MAWSDMHRFNHMIKCSIAIGQSDMCIGGDVHNITYIIILPPKNIT